MSPAELKSAIGLRPRDLARIEPPGELAIGIVAQLGGDDRPLPSEEQELAIGAECADFIGSEQGAAGMLLAKRQAGLFRIDRAAHGIEHDRFLPRQIGDELGAVLIVDPEHLQHPGVRSCESIRSSGLKAAEGRPVTPNGSRT